LSDLGIVPRGIDTEISDIMHRTLYGVDADPVNLLLAGLRCAVADLAGCTIGYLPEEALSTLSTELDVPLSRLFGVATFYSFFV